MAAIIVGFLILQASETFITALLGLYWIIHSPVHLYKPGYFLFIFVSLEPHLAHSWQLNVFVQWMHMAIDCRLHVSRDICLTYTPSSPQHWEHCLHAWTLHKYLSSTKWTRNQWHFTNKQTKILVLTNSNWLGVFLYISEFSALKISPFQRMVLFEEQTRNDCSRFLCIHFLPMKWQLALIQSLKAVSA